MKISKEYLSVTNDIIKCDALINFVLDGDVINIIYAFYLNDNDYKIFENLIKN